jgi:hypothetical protein
MRLRDPVIGGAASAGIKVGTAKSAGLTISREGL